MRQHVTATSGRRFHGVRTEHPIAQVDDVDILLDEDVAGEDAVPQPVA